MAGGLDFLNTPFSVAIHSCSQFATNEIRTNEVKSDLEECGVTFALFLLCWKSSIGKSIKNGHDDGVRLLSEASKFLVEIGKC